MNTLVLTIDPSGQGSCLYSELIELQAIGSLEVTRATQIEFNTRTQKWEVADVDGKILFSHPSRSVSLAWEQQRFNR